jgi:hypothetical protein
VKCVICQPLALIVQSRAVSFHYLVAHTVAKTTVRTAIIYDTAETSISANVGFMLLRVQL